MASGVQGLTTAQIIDTADKRTDRRTEDKLDQQTELLLAAQEVALERRWWWRRRAVSFTMTPGVYTYDLTDPTITTPLGGTAGLVGGMPDAQQIAKGGVKIFMPFSAPPPPTVDILGTGAFRHCLPDPVFETDRQDILLMLMANKQLPNVIPTQFFMVPGSPWTLAFANPPDNAYPVSLAAWCVPTWIPGGMPDVLPLVPGNLHTLVIKRLEMHFWQYLQGKEGEELPQYQTCAQEYQTMLERSAIYTDFAEGKILQVVDNMHEDSVRSTR